ncbi:2-succinyl-5-enolpyruvyl-6-hydroxy-3-cyclohexene-1-carboxylic-acid synthase [Effusibacillus dendaii]|uniref:2-succinyl-5-enolpyruvyl-6-hydroxy-3-cyclohexene-1-carboxylate synthase n=1 Tax=Effusibacillus dendaii TaxID=2743772 RepID=A0A7I8D838_9BACL|nr:2-succinyl-5-enolpyruvyl-6-hydroxy-3-cyclohexene-1-carboxylic-acid synthase [Effusibacillus dendaii]BCJ86308.1 2-succinyl-5-enolpyruvyl-6-hydroxy-3-cyclohexene- 1-carboxylate synthase [Effusibacillus dendaii]
MKNEELLHHYLGALIDELARSGVRHVCICPGSRSTPLAMRFADHPGFRIWIHIDERSAAFFALGMAKTLREPVALVCTSGTASANFFPAVVEAFHGRVPLIVLTADRPHELRDIGAPQTIDQLRLYGTHVKWFTEMALPETTPDMFRYVRTVASRAAAVAATAPSGPVHLNFPLREPLVPSAAEEANSFARTAEQPYVSAIRGEHHLSGPQMQQLADQLRRTANGLIVCGPLDQPDFAKSVVALAETLGYPVLADPLSQVRCGSHRKDVVINSYDAFLRDSRFVEDTVPEVVIRLGAMPVSKPLLLYLKRHSACRQIVVDTIERWNEPTLLATELVHASPVLFCQELNAQLASQSGLSGVPAVSVRGDASWLKIWQTANEQTELAMQDTVLSMQEPFEGRVFTELADLLPDGSVLYVGNSMPVRDQDTFFPRKDQDIRFLANRGANGIDGIVSSSLGAAAASEGPVVLVIGDLSFYHDLNGLLAAKRHGLHLTIILLNNDGGGIFSFLPQAEHPRHFETLFGTPIGLDFEKAVEMYGGSFTRPENWDTFRRSVTSALEGDGLHVIELRTDRQLNVRQHRQIWKAVSDMLDNGRKRETL